MKEKSVFTLSLVLFISIGSLAQGKPEITWRKITAQDFITPSSPVIDSSTNAVIIADMGDIGFVGNKSGFFSYTFTRKKRAKIINKKGFDVGTVLINVYNFDDVKAKLSSVEAVTYNNDDGKITEVKLDKKDIFEKRLNKYWIQYAFSAPALKEGSIFEFNYSIISPYIFSLPTWKFQDEQYPCLWSELNVEVPGDLSYSANIQANLRFTVDQTNKGHKTYLITDPMSHNASYGSIPQDLSVATFTNIHYWAMAEVPALNISKNQDFVSSLEHYKNKVQFQLYQIYGTEKSFDYVQDWKTATKFLLDHEFFEVMQEDNGWLKDAIRKQLTGENDETEIAKKIYAYFSNNFTCINHHEYLLNQSLKKIFNAKSGNVGEINSLLIASLRSLQINADPVILSTRDVGYNLNGYPLLENLDYLICKATLGGKVYFLDASVPHLSFGKLMASCYNGCARVLDENQPDSVYFNPDSLKETSKTSVAIINDEKNGISGNYRSTYGFLESFALRDSIRTRGEKRFSNDLQTQNGSDYQIRSVVFDSLNNAEVPLTIHFDFIMNADGHSDKLLFTPIPYDFPNVYRLPEHNRKYPIEFPYTFDQSFSLNMEIPAGYVVEELPKSVSIMLNEKDGAFEYKIRNDDKSVQLNVSIQVRKANFSHEQYPVLKDFFGSIIKKQNEKIVFKKK